MKSIFEETGGTYTLGADGMYYPDLELPEEEPHYGKYGRMRLRYLKEHCKVLYNTLLLDGKLVEHLNEVDDTANQRMELLTLQIEKDLIENGKVLRNAFLGNFPGTELKPINKIKSPTIKGVDGRSKKDIISESFKDAKFVSAVSSIPAIRNTNEAKNQEFVQGLEKLIETLRGKEYSALIIADAMSNNTMLIMSIMWNKFFRYKFSYYRDRTIY